MRGVAIRTLLVDDHELVRQGIAAMLQNAGDVQVVAEARTGREALEVARRELPDVVLMDVKMPDMDGLEATRKIKEERPRTAVVMLTMHDNPSYLRDAVRAGAAGYLLKDVSQEELIDAIRQVATGGAFIESQMLKGMLSEMKPSGGATPPAAKNLTKREREILTLVAEGMSNREIAERLVLSPETVKSHVAAILEKLNVSDRTQAAIYAVRNGLVETATS
jgi:DNA-binding NarL/FixJ family response regulator